MYIVVTGAAGFIGSSIIRALNARGTSDIIAVDNLKNGDKFRNLADCEIAHYVDKEDFIEQLDGGDFDDDIEAVLHQGACSDTMEHDGRYMLDNNYQYSLALLDYCQNEDIPYLYASSASVYGAGRVFKESREYENPLNVYGYSKFLFDQVVRRRWNELGAQVIGLRYFNVYGARESHKGRMASVAFHHFHQYRDTGRVKLFAGCDGYGDGEQRRDFVSIEDVVRVNLHFLDHPTQSGIFNLGTGRAQSFNELAAANVNACRRHQGLAPLPLAELVAQGIIEYIAFPEALKGKIPEFYRSRYRPLACRRLRRGIFVGRGRRQSLYRLALYAGMNTPGLRERALRLLSQREHSRTQLRRKLVGEGDEIEALLDELVERGWLSDHRFAERYVAANADRFGRFRLEMSLREHGVGAQDIADALAVLASQDAGELARARVVWSKKFAEVAEDAVGRARQARFLQTRGFSYEVISRVVGGLED